MEHLVLQRATSACFLVPENSVHDHRVDDIVYLVEQLFGYMARVWSEAAARDDQAVFERDQ